MEGNDFPGLGTRGNGSVPTATGNQRRYKLGGGLRPGKPRALAEGMTCSRCSKASPEDTRTGRDLCPEHALAALEQVGRRLADSRALLESAIRRARVFA